MPWSNKSSVRSNNHPTEVTSMGEQESYAEQLARRKAEMFRSRQQAAPPLPHVQPPPLRTSPAPTTLPPPSFTKYQPPAGRTSPMGKGPPPLPTQVQKSASKEEILAKNLLNPAELAHYTKLTVFAKQLVESHFSGKHKSADIGGGGEFAEFKHYEPGLAVDAIDWKIFAATKKLLIRTYREETDMAIHLLVDSSASMGYLGSGKAAKGGHAARIAAGLCYLTMRQGDDVSLTLFADAVLDHKPSGRSKRHLAEVLRTLVKPAHMASGRTDVAAALRASAKLLKRKGKLVVISDFLGCDTTDMLDEAARFIHRGYQVLFMQIRDPDESMLPSVAIARLVDMETQEIIEVEPELIRKEYQRDVENNTRELAEQCSRRRIEFSDISNQHTYREAIECYLGFRGGRTTR